MAVQPPLEEALIYELRINSVDDAYRGLLAAEERATANLIGFYREARLEITRLLEETPILTLSEARYYGSIRNQLNDILTRLDAGGSDYLRRSLSTAYTEGLSTHLAGSRVQLGEPYELPMVNRRALEALSRDSLTLITNVGSDVRWAIRQQVAQGIAQGLSGDELRRRLGMTGLTRGPWRDLETRAGVIARTETMRAYNSGALAGITATGAQAVQWIASPDEAACPICKPRDRRNYRLPGATDRYARSLDEYPGTPAHPRCRCTIRAQYRRPNGSMIGDPEEVEPVPGPVAQGQEGQPGPTAAGDLDSVIGRLKGPPATWDDALRERLVSMDLDDAALERLTRELTPLEWAEGLVHSRYGIAWEWPSAKAQYAWWTGSKGIAGRVEVLRGLERIRAVVPRYVQVAMDPRAGTLSSGLKAMLYLRRIQLGKAGRQTWLAHCSPLGDIVLSSTKLQKYLATGSLRADTVSGLQEVIIHEVGHSVHNRFGWGGLGASRSAAVEALDDDAWRAMIHEWEELRRASRGTWLTATQRAQYERNLAAVDANIAQVQGILDSLAPGSSVREYYRKQLRTQERYRRETLEALEPAEGERFPTTYAQESVKEDFAESFMLYLVQPRHLQKASPGRYAWMRRWIFGGQGGVP